MSAEHATSLSPTSTSAEQPTSPTFAPAEPSTSPSPRGALAVDRLSLTHPRAHALLDEPARPTTPGLRVLPRTSVAPRPSAAASEPATPTPQPTAYDPNDPELERALTELLREAARRHGIEV